MKEMAGDRGDIIEDVLQNIADTITQDDLEIYTSGATNIFKYPELADSESAGEIISAFEDKRELAEILRETAGDVTEETGIQVYIGQDSPIENMNDVSVVTTSYDLGGGMTGRIGIVGPRRMDYKNVVNNLKTLRAELDAIFKSDDLQGADDLRGAETSGASEPSGPGAVDAPEDT